MVTGGTDDKFSNITAMMTWSSAIWWGNICGRRITVECVHDGESGLRRSCSRRIPASGPRCDAAGDQRFEVLRRIRATSRLPVLLLTARGEDVDQIVGLEIGADDYLPKPFNPRELVARIRAVLRPEDTHRWRRTAATPDMVSVGDVELEPGYPDRAVGGQAR